MKYRYCDKTVELLQCWIEGACTKIRFDRGKYELVLLLRDGRRESVGDLSSPSSSGNEADPSGDNKQHHKMLVLLTDECIERFLGTPANEAHARLNLKTLGSSQERRQFKRRIHEFAGWLESFQGIVQCRRPLPSELTELRAVLPADMIDALDAIAIDLTPTGAGAT